MIRTLEIAVGLPSVRAFRWSCDERYTGLKSFYAVGRVERGCSEYRSGGKRWCAEPGTLVLKQPGDVHRDLSRGAPVSMQVVVLPSVLVEAVKTARRVHPQLAANDERSAPLHRLHDAIAHGAEALELDVALTEGVAAFAAVASQGAQPAAVRRAVELLRARLSEAVSLEDLAAEVGLDRFYLCHAFRAQLGVPPYAYLTLLRIARAKHLLATGVMPRDVAPRVGLYDQSQLNRHFRRIVGTTPGEFQRRERSA
ncbi:MAG TPA: AraC family transcriptional regulator [Kofleriaceae bacterium]